MGQIYLITNNINGKQYVGQTHHTAEERFKEHIYGRTRDDRKFCCPLYMAMNKYGVENFSMCVLEECDDTLLDEKEIYWIDKLGTFEKNGYNATRGGKGSVKLDYKAIVECYLENHNQRVTAELMNVSRAEVRKACKRYGIETDNRPKYDYEEVAKKYLELKNITKTAEYFGCDKCVVRKACKDYNINTPKTLAKPVYQLDIETDEILKTFPSARQAGLAMGSNNGSCITDCCNGKQKTAYGYKWRFTNGL